MHSTASTSVAVVGHEMPATLTNLLHPARHTSLPTHRSPRNGVNSSLTNPLTQVKVTSLPLSIAVLHPLEDMDKLMVRVTTRVVKVLNRVIRCRRLISKVMRTMAVRDREDMNSLCHSSRPLVGTRMTRTHLLVVMDGSGAVVVGTQRGNLPDKVTKEVLMA